MKTRVNESWALGALAGWSGTPIDLQVLQRAVHVARALAGMGYGADELPAVSRARAGQAAGSAAHGGAGEGLREGAAVLLALTALHHGKIGRMARPHGELVQALQAAAGAGPGTVRELAHRGLVGLSVARYTASRMVDRGQLVVVDPSRPAVLALPAACTEDAVVGVDLVGVLAGWRKT